MAQLTRAEGLPLVSVVICTHDRAHVLARTLPHVLRSTREVPGALEVIVVDNASADDTAAQVRRISLEERVECRVITHSRLGLSGARNAGADAARALIVWYLDDDAVPRSGWAPAITRAATSTGAGIMGGRAFVVWPKREPAWLPREMRGYYGDANHGDVDRALKWPEYPFGVNMGVRKSAFDEVGGFRDWLGRREGTLLSNEEKEFAFRVVQAGWPMAYFAAATVDHLIADKRVKVRWLLRRVYWQGVSDALFQRSRPLPNPMPLPPKPPSFLVVAFRRVHRLLRGPRGWVFLGARLAHRAGLARGRRLAVPGALL